MVKVKHLENGLVEVNGQSHKLPNAITSVKGNPDDMLILKLKKVTYTQAFLLGCSVLAEREESDIDIMRKEFDSSQTEYDLLTFKMADLKKKIDAYDQVQIKEEVQSSSEFEMIVKEFERLMMSAGYHKKPTSMKHLSQISNLSEDTILSIYVASTPKGSISPNIGMVRAAVENVIL